MPADDPQPATEVVVQLDASNHDAVIALAELLGEIAADLWLDGIGLTDVPDREIVKTP